MRNKITHTVSVKLVTTISIHQLNHRPLHKTFKKLTVFDLGPFVLLYVIQRKQNTYHKIPLLLCTRGGEIGGESSRYNTIPSLHKERRKYYEL